MLEKIKKILINHTLDDIYLTGFVDIDEDGTAEFHSMMRFLYFEFGDQLIEFETIDQYSRLRITMVDSVRHEFETDESVILAKSSIDEVVLIDTMSAGNKIANLCFYNFEVSEGELLCDALHMKLVNGQDLFLDPSFYFGINIGGLEQKHFWEENLIDRSIAIPKETKIITGTNKSEGL